MNNAEKYTGKVVNIYTPNGRRIDQLKVNEVLDDNVLCGESLLDGVVTSYYLSDKIRVWVN